MGDSVRNHRLRVLYLAAMKEPIDDGYCNARPKGLNWPVCALIKGHAQEKHESADFWWLPGDGIVYPKRGGNAAS